MELRANQRRDDTSSVEITFNETKNECVLRNISIDGMLAQVAPNNKFNENDIGS